MQKTYVSLSKLSTFLDNLKNTFSALGHKHTISDLTDYTVDTELSNTSTNPVANSTIKTAIEALNTVASGKAAATHEHTISDVADLQAALDDKVNGIVFESHANDTTLHITSTERTNWNAAKTHADSAHAPSDAIAQSKAYTDSYFIPVTTSTVSTGSAYTITVDSIKAFVKGVSFIMIPNVVSTSTTPTLNVNNFGAKQIRRKLSTNTGTAVAGSSVNWLTAGKPIRVTYDGTYWIADITRPSATDMYGVLPIASGGTGASSASAALTKLGAMADVSVTTDDVGKFLRVNSSGVWAAETIPNKVLWSGEWFGDEPNGVTLSEAVTAQTNGIVLVFSITDAAGGSALNTCWNEYFVPKQAITYGNGKLRNVSLWGVHPNTYVTLWALKRIYLSDTTITGLTGNGDDGDYEGMPLSRAWFVLRYVIGV